MESINAKGREKIKVQKVKAHTTKKQKQGMRKKEEKQTKVNEEADK